MRNFIHKVVRVWAVVGLAFCALVLPGAVRGQEAGPCNPAWYDAAPPNPDWGLPPTLGQMLPIQYYDSDSVVACFLAPLEGLQTLLPVGVRALAVNEDSSPWKPILGSSVSGFGVLVVAFIENHSVQYVGAYSELSVSVMVDDRSSNEGFLPIYVTAMVLNNEPAVWGGIAGWGLPKRLGDVHFKEIKPKGIKCFASADDGSIMKVQVDTTDLLPSPPSPTMSLSTKDGYLVRVPYAPSGSQAASFSIGKVTITLGNHPIARQLQAIGIGEYPSIGQIVGKHQQSILPAGICEFLGPAAPIETTNPSHCLCTEVEIEAAS